MVESCVCWLANVYEHWECRNRVERERDSGCKLKEKEEWKKKDLLTYRCSSHSVYGYVLRLC
jgi:hypothetical protein